jgi:hypothetical protein
VSAQLELVPPPTPVVSAADAVQPVGTDPSVPGVGLEAVMITAPLTPLETDAPPPIAVGWGAAHETGWVFGLVPLEVVATTFVTTLAAVNVPAAP